MTGPVEMDTPVSQASLVPLLRQAFAALDLAIPEDLVVPEEDLEINVLQLLALTSDQLLLVSFDNDW